ncbi:MAG TPA: SDR family oxidoreductase [Thermoanaerobaculia bacterium]
MEPTLIITGVGYRLSEGSTETIDIDPYDPSTGAKVNIGAAVAYEAVALGFPVMLLSRTARKLVVLQRALRARFEHARVDTYSVDVTDSESVTRWATGAIGSDLRIGLVHCVGLSAGDYRLRDDNPYMPVDEIPAELPIAETSAVLTSLLNLVKSLLPSLRRCAPSRIVVVTSMSGIRPFPLGFSHAAAKAALHNATRSLALELYGERIYVSEVAPGIVDTGMYDPTPVREAVQRIGRSFGRDYAPLLPSMPPSAVAAAVMLCLRNDAHILAVNMVAQDQWPHMGA